MEGLKVCRACLATDVKMFSTQGALEINYRFLIGEHIISSGSLPHFICYECTELIMKSTMFKEKCLRSQMALCSILRNNAKITEHDIKQIDRKSMKLESNLSVCLLPSENLSQPQIEVVQIKEECSDLDMFVDEAVEGVGSDDVMNDDDDDLPLKYVSTKKRKKIKKQKQAPTGKKARLKDKVTVSSTKNTKKPKTGNVSTVGDDIQKYFVVTKLTIEEQIAEVLKRKDCANYRDSPFKCHECYKGFLLEDTFRNHMARHDARAGDILCGVCKARSPTARAHALHAARHARRYQCRACSFNTVHMDQAKKHKAWHDGVTYKCQYCSEVSTKLTSYLSHVRVKHPSPWVCAACGYSFVSERGLKMHRARMHKPEDTPKQPEEPEAGDRASRLYCPECGLRFASEAALKRHTVTSARHRDHLGTGCRECGEVFPTGAALRAHRRAHAHNLEARARLARARYVSRAASAHGQPYPAQCEHCEELIASRSRHGQHHQRCHQEHESPPARTNFVCELCGKGFQVRAFLTYHQRAHAAPRRPRTRMLSCALCSKQFDTMRCLQQHSKDHADEASPHPREAQQDET